MATRESLTWDAAQDWVAEDQHARALSQALASPDAVVSDFLSQLEAGHVVISSDGSLLFDTGGSLAVEVVVDSAEGGQLRTTFWADDENGDPVEIATVRLTAEVIA